MKISVITNGLSRDFEVACQIMRETGVKYAEVQHHNGRGVEYSPIEEAYKIKEIAAKYGITPICITTHAFVGIPVGSLQVGDDKYNEQLALLRRGYEFAKILDVKLVRSMCFSKQIVTFGSHGGEDWVSGGNKAWPMLVERFKPIVALADEMGIDVAVENGFNGMISSTEMFKLLYEDLGKPERLKMLWDPANALYYGEKPTPEVYMAMKDLIAHIHIKDVSLNVPRSTADVRQIGRGDMAPYLQDLAKALRDTKYEGCVSLENIYKPDGKDFVDGYRLDIVELKKIFA